VLRLRKGLVDEELVVATTFSQAMAALARQRFDVVLIGMLFDESRALEFMRAIRADERLAGIPVIGMRGAKTARPISPELFDVPMFALGAADVIDFAAIPDDEAGNAHIAARIRACIKE
jgi:PleD family two-component response regulator